MKIDPPEFAKVPLDDPVKNACSPPEPALPWLGVVIRTPKRITFSKSDGCTRLPVCAFYRISATAKTNAGLLLFVKDLRNNKVTSGRISGKDPSPDEPPPESKPIDPKLLEGVSTAGYYNPNLVEYIKLPAETATYDVHVEFAGLRSNVVRIELVAE